MNDGSYTRPTPVIRRAMPPMPHPPCPPDDTLRDEFRALRKKLPGASPAKREELLLRLNEILRLQEAIRAHADFFHPDRRPLPHEVH